MNSTDADPIDFAQSALADHRANPSVKDSTKSQTPNSLDENRFQKLFKQHSAIMLVIDPESAKIVDANKAAEDFYGWPLEKLQQMGVQEINTLPADIIKTTMEKISLSQENRFLFQHRRADGSIRDVEVFCNKIESAEKALLFSIIHDITERKQAEDALREEERFLRTILQTTADGFWLVDTRGKLLQVNEAYCRMSGYTCAELVNLSVFDLDAVDKPNEVSARIKRIIAHGSDLFETFHKRKDGSIFPVEVSIMYLKSASARFVCFCRDISERTRIQNALQKNQEDLQTILDASPIMIYLKDCDNRFIQVNKTLAEFAGLPKKAIEGKKVADFFPDQAEVFWEEDKEIIASGKGKKGIIRLLETPIGPRWLQTDKIPYRDIGGDIIGILGFSVDITAIKLANNQLREINNELERRVEKRTRELQETHLQYLHAGKLAAIGKLSASIAHEFNNPLQGVMAVLKGLKKRAILEEEDKELLDAAIVESERMKKLIGSLQDFNRPSSCSKTVMDVQKSIDSLLLLHKSDFKSKKISLQVNHAKRLPQIMAIPDQIKQVFLNLITNAADACLKPGREISISTWQEGDRVAISIKDNGVGIQAEQMDLIFQPFYTTKPEVKGTGLGLSVSFGIVKNHQGEIRVDSQPGKGATFTVLLPIKAE